MKRLIFVSACAIALAIAQNLVAGPEALPSGKEMKEVAPAPAPECFNWTGFYIGGFGGYKKAVVDTTFEGTDSWLIGVDNARTIRAHTADDLDTDGGEAGGMIGFNFQMGCWVFGIEGDGGYLWARDSFDSGTFVMPAASDKSIQQAFHTNYLATFGGRVGYAIGNWLPYFTGGGAFGNIDYETRLHNVNTSGAGFYASGDEESNDNFGWYVGGGLQYALSAHWSIRGQYEYVDLGSVSFDSPGSFPFDTFSTHSRAALREHNFSFGLMFKF